MKPTLASVAAVLVGLFAATGAHAGGPRTIISNSANGAGNRIHVHNGFGGWGGFGMPGFVGYQPTPFIGGYDAGFAGFPAGPAFGGFNFNSITNSGNGQGNAIMIQNGGNLSYRYPGGVFGGIAVGGVNVNVITNSGNGVGNSIGILNR